MNPKDKAKKDLGEALPEAIDLRALSMGDHGGEPLRPAIVRSLLSAAASEKATPAEGVERDALGFPWDPEAQSYGSAWEKVAHRSLFLEDVLQRDRLESEELVERLLTELPARRRMAICEDTRLHTVAVCESLLKRAWDTGFDEPAEAVELAELAVSVAAELGSEAGLPSAVVYDFKARSWAYLGNARRISSDLRGADRAFEMAESLLKRGTGDPVEAGRLAELQASLCLARHRLDEAEVLLRRASSLYRRSEAEHHQGRVKISQGLLWGRREQMDKAIGLLRRGLDEIDPGTEPRLTLVAVHNLALYLSESGSLEEGLQLLAEARQLHQSFANRLDLARLRWLEGRIALAAGRVKEAGEAFAEARDSFIRHQVGYDAALASLDLAGVYAREGRAAEMRRLAEEMLPIFRARDLGREVMAALIVLENATRMETASVALIEELSALLKASRQDPEDPLGP